MESENAHRPLAPGTRVRLRAFEGEATAPPDVEPHENYWRLVRQPGTVRSVVAPAGIRSDCVLIDFDVNVSGMGLSCHNEVENALWISRSDIAWKRT